MHASAECRFQVCLWLKACRILLEQDPRAPKSVRGGHQGKQAADRHCISVIGDVLLREGLLLRLGETDGDRLLDLAMLLVTL